MNPKCKKNRRGIGGEEGEEDNSNGREGRWTWKIPQKTTSIQMMLMILIKKRDKNWMLILLILNVSPGLI
jgi:hypothetical protein